MTNDLSKLLPSVKPEFFSSPHAWETEEEKKPTATEQKPAEKSKKPKPKPKKTSPQPNKQNTAAGSKSVFDRLGEHPQMSSGNKSGKVKKEISLEDIQHRRKRIQKPVPLSSHSRTPKSYSKSFGNIGISQEKSQGPPDSEHRPDSNPGSKHHSAPKPSKISLFKEVDDWAEAGLDGETEFDFSEIPKWD